MSNKGSKAKDRLLVSRTVTFHDAEEWRGDVDLVDERGYVNSRAGKFPRHVRPWAHRWFEFQFALHLLFHSRRCRAAVVGRYGIWFPVVQRMLGIRRPVVMTDIEWPKVKKGRLNRAAALGSIAVSAFTRVEIERYSRRYRIPREKFFLCPATFQATDIFPSSDRGYIFSGGRQARDWGTLAKASQGLPYLVRVFTDNPVPVLTPNMTVESVNREQFCRQMAGASCVVITLRPEPMRITGIMTWATAMAMGKVVIVTEPLGAPDYMEHGVSGFYTDYGDWEAVRRHIVQVMEDAELRRRVGQAARERAWKECSPDAFRSRVLRVLDGQRRTEELCPTEVPGPTQPLTE